MQENNLHKDNEHNLMLISQGNRVAFTQLYQDLMPRLMHYILPFVDHDKEEAAEVVQEIFLKIWIQKHKLKTVLSLDAYVFRMTKNLLCDRFKAQKSRQKMIDSMPEKWNLVTSGHEAVVYKEYLESANRLIHQLSPQRQRIFKMRTQKEMAIDEIADVLNISRSAVKKQLYESIKKIKSQLNYEHGWSIFWLLNYLFL